MNLSGDHRAELSSYTPQMSSPAHSLPLARRQIGLLAVAQALLYINNVTQIAINALAGLALAPSPVWATLPITTYIIGSALTTMPASLLMGRVGRRAGFMVGALCGVAGMCMAAGGVLAGSFSLLCAGTFVVGFYNAFAQYLRFAAADVADAYAPQLKERAIAWVLAAGIAGGIIGPELSKFTRELMAPTFAATYLALAAFSMIALIVTSRLRIPHHHATTLGPARPLAEIAAQPTFLVAVACAAIAFGAMNLLMVATPLAMKMCGFGYPDSADVIKWHVIGMFAPGFFTGSLIKRFGVLQVMFAGCALMAATVGVALHGIAYWNFWIALVLLGVGWNFLFTGATTLLTTTYTPAEKAKVQGVNDLVVFLVMITSSAASGALLSASGWDDLNLLALPVLVVAACAVLYLMAHRRRLAVA